ncbi:MAG: hypothetical protein ABL961_15225 [Vicinamibacterales bacterium]
MAGPQPEGINSQRRAEGPWSDLALHTIGWKAFQDLCSQVCEEVLHQPVEIFHEAQDGGQDAVFLIHTSRTDQSVVGTVQCKHSTVQTKQLRKSDLGLEFENVVDLVAAGQADTYVLMTSMGVGAPEALKIRRRLAELGVRKPHILGKQYLIRTIRQSARLRALVPQVYGLGDLGAILDERLIQQTRALLDSWIPKLRRYVPTAAHRKAVAALSEHGIVLLLGNPSSGKSAIGAILSTIASEDLRHTVFNLTSPRDFEASWNPNEPGRFYWIDDAFGSNVLREEYVQDWTAAFRKVQAAITRGNRFLLTSRRHIYEAAKIRLGQRNLPIFANERAVVDVGQLTIAERRQILYNHITFGEQTLSWKRSVKPHLEAVAQVADFLPGIAERLGDPSFTKGLGTAEVELVRFMKEPREHLIDTINALDEPLRAALMLVYVHQGALHDEHPDSSAADAVSQLAGIPLPRIRSCLGDLHGSFLKTTDARGYRVWGFAHPTIADALTDILKARPHMIEALVRGAALETILRSVVCEGAQHVPDAPVVPTTLDDVLVARLAHIPDEQSVNWLLFNFLAHRCNENVFKRTLAAQPELLARDSWGSHSITSDAKVLTHARAYSYGLLDADLQDTTASELETAALDLFDLSFFDEPAILRLVPPRKLVALGLRLRTEALVELPERITSAGGEADASDSARGVFGRFSDGLDTLEGLGDLDDSTERLISAARASVEEATEVFRERKAAEEKEDHSAEWEYMSSTSPKETPEDKNLRDTRSVFADVDH